VPLALVATLWLRTLAGPGAPLVPAFWSLVAAAVIAAAVWPRWVGQRPWRMALAASVALTGIGHAAALMPMVPAVLAIDGVLITLGILGLFLDSRLLTRRRPLV